MAVRSKGGSEREQKEEEDLLRTLSRGSFLTVGLQGSKGEDIPEITKLRRSNTGEPSKLFILRDHSYN